jgi:Uncharacterized protein conserved in bacteria (DUF2252)
MAVQRIAHPSVTDRSAEGRQARDRTPLSSHQRWAPAAERPDPVALLEERDATREPDLVPVRHGRTLVSPFAFYRGAAKLMAADLKGTPRPGWTHSCAATPTCRTSGRSVAYLGEDDQFDRSITAFSERYADQNEQDYQAFVGAIHSGRLQALEGM